MRDQIDFATATSLNATKAFELVVELQKYFAERLAILGRDYGSNNTFESASWQRDGGIHGGGWRVIIKDRLLFNTGSINVSQVHYEDSPEKLLNSATAISTIIHPLDPHLASFHMHISFTEQKIGRSYFRIMADLNPSHDYESDRNCFDQFLRSTSKEYFQYGSDQGAKYFFIPCLNIHRGVSHFYLEDFFTDDLDAGFAFAKHFGNDCINCYSVILEEAIQENRSSTGLTSQARFNPYLCKFDADVQSFDSSRLAQLAYHTLYLLQVLLLDRGTTSGILVHNENDTGILASLPSIVDLNLLRSWVSIQVDQRQKDLLEMICDCLKASAPVVDFLLSPTIAREIAPVHVNDPVKISLATTIRRFYSKYQAALDLQASGFSVPPTVENHSGNLERSK